MLRFVLPVLLISFFFVAPAYAGFDEGKAAYDKQDWVTAIKELRPLAETGDDRAMILIANMYNDGLGVIQSPQEAMALYKRAAVEKNNTDAMVALAAMYTSGVGVTQNMNQAMKWFERSAQLGNQTAAFFYATVLFQGNKSETDDIKPDLYSAYKWFKIASVHGANDKVKAGAKEIAEKIGKDKLAPTDMAKADKEVDEWKPSDVASLGPAPADLKN